MQAIEMLAVTNFSKSLYISYMSIKSLSSKEIRYLPPEKRNACIVPKFWANLPVSPNWWPNNVTCCERPS